ncbi:MAG: c-type cytochrome [Actinobacteria bacterium]|nr:c-type cytochrome [Actinomycetota bacterium]
MRAVVALVFTAVAVTILLGGTSTAQPAAQSAAVERLPTPTVYLRDCGVCHGAEGRGTDSGPSIAGVGRALVDYEISTGRMPIPQPDSKIVRRPARYSATETRALVDYVAAFGTGGSGGPDIPRLDVGGADLAAGGEQYRLQCAACHAWAGDGGALAHREAPGLHRASATQIAEAIRTGPGTMPAFGAAALDDEQLAGVVRYVRYLNRPRDRGGFGLWHLGPVPEGAVAWLVGLALLILATRWIGEKS